MEGKPRENCDCDHSIKHKTCSETSSSEEEEEEEEEEEDRGRRFAERGVCASGIRGEREREREREREKRSVWVKSCRRCYVILMVKG